MIHTMTSSSVVSGISRDLWNKSFLKENKMGAVIIFSHISSLFLFTFCSLFSFSSLSSLWLSPFSLALALSLSLSLSLYFTHDPNPEVAPLAAMVIVHHIASNPSSQPHQSDPVRQSVRSLQPAAS